MVEKQKLISEIEKQLCTQVVSMTQPWDNSEWSRTFRIKLISNQSVYLKGSPRLRHEVKVHQLVATYDSTIVPIIIADDLLPDHDWQWFILQDVGESSEVDHNNVTILQACFELGQLQKKLATDGTAKKFLPQVEPKQLLSAISSIYDWVRIQKSNQIKEIEQAYQTIKQNSSKFEEVVNSLSAFPTTIVHGDFWTGNIIHTPTQLIFLDWADSVWGVGAVSIVNLLSSLNEIDFENAWTNYSHGFGISITPNHYLALELAYLTTNLVIDRNIAETCNNGIEMLPGILPTFESISLLLREL